MNQPRWLLRLEADELRLVDGEPELAELFRLGRVSSATPVYEITSGPRALGDLPGMARVLLSPAESAPPIRGEHRSPERDLLSEELAVLDRPLEIEYEDERPTRRRPRWAAVVIALAAVAIAAAPMLAPRVPGWRARAMALVHRALPSRLLAEASPRPAPPPAPPAAAPRPTDGVPLALPAAVVAIPPAGAAVPAAEAPEAQATADDQAEASHASTNRHHSHRSGHRHPR
ncbi:MAG TPA: hypothetical protein VKZ18_16990 [Polyangia bacterium]|nr:hypothetical protein [Polyangia bacterium]